MPESDFLFFLKTLKRADGVAQIGENFVPDLRLQAAADKEQAEGAQAC